MNLPLRAETDPFRVGDRVVVPWRHPIVGEVIEVRGPVNRLGRYLCKVSVPMDPDEPMLIDVASDDLSLATEDDPEPESGPMADYLKHGGLVAILRQGQRGGRNQPRAWLRTDSLGNVIHTFDPSRGMKGGQAIPARALHGPNRIFLPKADEVVAFVEGFGIDRPQAEAIVSAVGTAP